MSEDQKPMRFKLQEYIDKVDAERIERYRQSILYGSPPKRRAYTGFEKRKQS